MSISRRAILGSLAVGLAGLGAGSARAGQKVAVAQYGQFMGGFPWLVALRRGFLKAEGLDIDGFISSQGGGTSVRNFLASTLPFGEVASSAAIAAIKEGFPVVIVYGGTNHPGEIAWMTLPDKPIGSIKDLVGKTIGYTSAKSTTEMLLRMSLDAAGIKPGEVKLVATGGLGGGLASLNAGAIDAAPIVDPVLTKSGGKYKEVFRAADVVTQLTFNFGVTTPEFASKSPDTVRKLVRARRAAVDWLYANPAAAVEICAEFLEVDRALAERILPKFIGWKYWSAGNFTRDGLENNIRGLELIGAVEGTVDWSKVVDQRFLPEDLRTTL
ncbi:MAG: ABC transporter substrate-binding protein [Alphaproteobacteria bacterium]